MPDGGSPNKGEDLIQLTGHGRERPAGQRRRGQVQLEVEAVDLQDHSGIGGVSPDCLIARQGATLVVNEEQLQLGPDGAGAGAEAGASQQPGQSEQAFLQAPLKPQVIGLVELLTLDRESHRRAVSSH